MRMKQKSRKAGLKLNIQKTKILVSGPITLWQIDGGKVEIVTDFLFFSCKSLPMMTASMNLEDTCSFEEKLLTNIHSVLKNRDITLLIRVHIVEAMVFLVIYIDRRVGPKRRLSP